MKQTYLCTHACQYMGDVVKKGARVVVDSADLKAPGREALAHSFRLLDAPAAAQPTPAHADDKPKKLPAGLLARAASLGITVPDACDADTLRSLIATAASPDGHQKD